MVFKSRRDGAHPRHGSSCEEEEEEEEEEEPMLVVAMEMRLDKLRNSKVRGKWCYQLSVLLVEVYRLQSKVEV